MKNYDFVCMPNNNGLNINNPLSSCNCTSDSDAIVWAVGLLSINLSAEYVLFSHNNGKTLLKITREDGILYRNGHRYTGAMHDINNCQECATNDKIVLKANSHRAGEKLRRNFGLSQSYYHKSVFDVVAKGGFWIVEKTVGEAILKGSGSNWYDSKPVKGVAKAKDQKIGNYYPCL